MISNEDGVRRRFRMMRVVVGMAGVSPECMKGVSVLRS